MNRGFLTTLGPALGAASLIKRVELVSPEWISYWGLGHAENDERQTVLEAARDLLANESTELHFARRRRTLEALEGLKGA